MARYRFDQRIVRLGFQGKRTVVATFDNARPIDVYEEACHIASRSRRTNDELEIEYRPNYEDGTEASWRSVSELGERSLIMANITDRSYIGFTVDGRTVFDKLRNRRGNKQSAASHRARNARAAAEAAERRAKKKAEGLARHAANIQAAKDAAAARRAERTARKSKNADEPVMQREQVETPAVQVDTPRRSNAQRKTAKPKAVEVAQNSARENEIFAFLAGVFPDAKHDTFTEENITEDATLIEEGLFHYHRNSGVDDEWELYEGSSYQLSDDPDLRIVLLTSVKDSENVKLIMHDLATGEQTEGSGLCMWDPELGCAATEWWFSCGLRNRYTFIGGTYQPPKHDDLPPLLKAA